MASKIDFTTFLNVIDGKLENSEKTRNPVNPSTLEENPTVPVSSQQDVDKAVAAARKAQGPWAEISWADRAAALKKVGGVILEHIEELSKLVVKENGKPVSGLLTFAQ